MQFPEGLVFAESQALCGFVREITGDRTLSVVVAVCDVAFRQWRLYEDGIFENGSVAVPKCALTIRGVNLNKKGMSGEVDVPGGVLPMQTFAS